MMVHKIIFTGILAISALGIFAQDTANSIAKLLDAVVVTGTRTENRVGNLPMPIQVINGSTIRESGAVKLLEVLQMHTGLVMATNPLGVALQGYPNPFGSGVQMQGMDPAYTLVMIDGEPLTGRNAGILNLGRIALGNIKQIEIMRGPATSLYGSDALAGVINIITETPQKDGLRSRLHYGTNNTWGTSLSGDLVMGNTAVQIFGKRYSSRGWDLDEEIYGQTMDPFVNYALNVKTVTQLSKKGRLTFSGRYFHDKQRNNYQIFPENTPEVLLGNTIETDKSIYAKLEHTIHDELKYIASVYVSGYGNHAKAFLKKNDSLYEEITLQQLLLKPEIQFNIGKKEQQWVAGAGYNYETIHSSRYSAPMQMNSWYSYVQKQWHLRTRINIIAGARFDKNSLYPAQLSPKLAAAWKVNPDFVLKGSVGIGFKAPDFRQQFLNFSNDLVGYTIVGARELGHALRELKASGQLPPSANIEPYLDGTILDPEKSIGINLGFDWTIKENAVVQLNLFRNDISNLIETYNLPFVKTNGKTIFSYINVNKVFTEGAEMNVSYRWNKHFRIRAGYHFLIAKDKKVLDQIKGEQLYRRDPQTGKSQLVTLQDYKGLYNRSRHTAHLQLEYDYAKWDAGARISVKYRGKYGFRGISDYVDGNLILDDPREFTEGYVLANLVVHKDLGDYFKVQAGIENILDHTQPVLMPGQFGRGYFVNLNFKL